MERAVLACLVCAACTPVCPEGDCPGPDGAEDLSDGWDDPIGVGRVYAVSSIAIGNGSTGFDVDGLCQLANCEDNRLSALAVTFNAQIEQAHGLGMGRTLIELAGADAFPADDPRVTLKTYDANDADDRFDNDFLIGDRACCRFVVKADSSVGDRRARWRAPAVVVDEEVRSAGIGTLAFTLPLATGPRVLTLERPSFLLSRPSPFDPKLSVLLGGAVPAVDLAGTVNPLCSGSNNPCPRQDATLLDHLVARGIQPDIDLDGDGLETFVFDSGTGRVAACFDGCSEGCPNELPIAPEDVDRPWSCTQAGSVRDGYSVGLILAATPAVIREVQ